MPTKAFPSWFDAKIAQDLESLRQRKGLDGEAVMAELLAELDGPEPAR
jgi:hypothetical protein